MHLGHAARQIRQRAAAQPAQGLVPKPRRGHGRRPGCGDFRAQTSAAGLSDAARERDVAGLPMPYPAARNAHPSNRHRPVQVRRVQAERIHPCDQKSRVLEGGTTLSRRHRMDGDPEPLDPDARLYRRQVRYDLSVRSHRAIDARHQEPGARCNLRADAGTGRVQSAGQPRRSALRQSGHPPGDAADDRKSFVDILLEGQGDIGGAMQTPPGGLWGLPPEILATLPGYGPDVAKNRAEARKLMEKYGYRPDQRLPVKVATRNIAQYRDPAVILIDQLKEIYIDGELDAVETVNWFPKIARKDFMVGANLSGSGVDDPDAYFYEHYACGSERNYTNYCNPELEKMYEQQSIEPDQAKRKKLVWEIDRRLTEDGARPIIFNYRLGTCHYPRVHGITVLVKTLFNGWRLDNAWLGQ